MIITPAFQRILTAVESAEHNAIRGFSQGSIETEPTLTDRLLGAIEVAFEQGLECEGYSIRVRTLRDRGPNCPEKEFGADLISVLHVDVKGFSISKGFLAQAKISGKEGIIVNGSGKRYPDVYLKLNESSSRLITQCKQMLWISPDSYVFIYTKMGIYVIPASTVVSVAKDNIQKKVNMKTLRWFMEDYLRSFIGDLRLQAFDDATLRNLREITSSNYGLFIEMFGPQK